MVSVCLSRRVPERQAGVLGVLHALAPRAAALPAPARARDGARAPPAAPRRRAPRAALAGDVPQGVLQPSVCSFYMEFVFIYHQII